MRRASEGKPEAGRAVAAADYGPVTPSLSETGFVLGHGVVWLDLVGTVIGWHYDRPIELLDSPARLRSWLRLQDLDIGRNPTRDELEHVRRIRTALRELASAVVDKRPPERVAIRTVNELLADQVVGLRLGYDTGRERLVLKRPRSVAEALASLCKTAVSQLAGPEADRLRDCQADDCTRIFLPPNGRRQWCPSGRCGNRIRVRAHRARTHA